MILASLIPIAGPALVVHRRVARSPRMRRPLIGGTLLSTCSIGAMIASVCGYMAGLIGASNSPISGIGILAVLSACGCAAVGCSTGASAGDVQALIAYALFATAIVFGDRDHLQRQPPGPEDRPAGRRDAVAPAAGPGLRRDLRRDGHPAGARHAEHAPSASPGARARARTRSPAPQAALISSLATGVLGGDLNWRMLIATARSSASA